MSVRFGFVSTFPPTQCGLATFTTSLRNALVRQNSADSSSDWPDEGMVVRLMEAPEPQTPDGAVVAQLVQGDPASMRAAVERLEECDAVILQHEYGIYGGADGDEILDLLAQLRRPSIVVLHTVLTTPSDRQRWVLENVARLADAVVTMTAVAADRLATLYDVDMDKVRVIGHGAPEVMAAASGSAGHRPTVHGQLARPIVLTWGLIGPGKGIEWGIAAMAQLRDLYPTPRYVVAGQTHPKVLLHEGEAYRGRLEGEVTRLGLGGCVEFDRHYRNAAALAELVRTADVVLLPYDSTDQVTSGVLIEAVAAGKPVVATAFPHAVELLGSGAGTVVGHRDPSAIAGALRRILTDSYVSDAMARAAASASPGLRWSAVAGQYRELAHSLIHAGVAA